MSWRYGWRPYVPVARRRANAATFAAKLAKKEKRTLTPIELAGRTIAASFWGKAWCQNLEAYSDYENRLPRGRSYVRNGSVIDLQIERGKVKAIVSGSEIYRVTIDIKTLPAPAWSRIKQDCARSIDSLIDLLQGRFDQGIMERLSQRDGGMFPKPKEIKMACSCPDWAGMCKHVAAALFGVGARLDHAPELLFTLRAVDHLELISQAVDAKNLDQALAGHAEAGLAGADLGAVFGIDLDVGHRGMPDPSEDATAEIPSQNKTPTPRGRKNEVAKNGKGKKVAPSVAAAVKRLANQAQSKRSKRKAHART